MQNVPKVNQSRHQCCAGVIFTIVESVKWYLKGSVSENDSSVAVLSCQIKGFQCLPLGSPVPNVDF